MTLDSRDTVDITSFSSTDFQSVGQSLLLVIWRLSVDKLEEI